MGEAGDAGPGKTKGASRLGCAEFEVLAIRPSGNELHTGCIRGRDPGTRVRAGGVDLGSLLCGWCGTERYLLGDKSVDPQVEVSDHGTGPAAL